MYGIPHAWDLSPTEAIELQKSLAAQIDTRTAIDLRALELVAGVDVSVKENTSHAAIVVMTFPDLEIVETVTAEMPTPFPYISGLLSFREGAVILEAHEQLQSQPGAYIFDGQGIAHPRRLGIASHIGLWWNRPTIGCGKTRLIGQHAELEQHRGAYEYLWDRTESVGAILRTRANVAPVYVSVGHKADLDSAIDLILACTTRYRLPEPIRAAHHAAGDFEVDAV